MSRRRTNTLRWLFTTLTLLGCSSDPSATHTPPADTAQAGDSGNDGFAGGHAGGLPGVPEPGTGGAVSDPCNGRVEYCALHYGELVQPTANAAATYLDPPFHVLHQGVRVLEQLRAGVRALSLEVREDAGVAVLCAGTCSAGELPLYAVLDDVEQFLAESPRGVVSLLMDVHTTREVLVNTLVEHPVAKRLHALGAPPFATFEQLIDAEERLVLLAHFLDDGSSEAPDPGAGGAGGAADEGDTGASPSGAAGTAGAAMALDPSVVDARINDLSEILFDVGGLDSTADLPCARASGSAKAPLYRMSQVIAADSDADSAALLANAELSNDTDVIERRARYCQVLWRHAPSFVAVDYFDTGGVLQATQDLTLESLAPSSP